MSAMNSPHGWILRVERPHSLRSVTAWAVWMEVVCLWVDSAAPMLPGLMNPIGRLLVLAFASLLVWVRLEWRVSDLVRMRTGQLDLQPKVIQAEQHSLVGDDVVETLR